MAPLYKESGGFKCLVAIMIRLVIPSWRLLRFFIGLLGPDIYIYLSDFIENLEAFTFKTTETRTRPKFKN